MLLASEAWVGVSRRLRTPPSSVLAGGLRATRPKNHPKERRAKRPRRKEWMRVGNEVITKKVEGGQLSLERSPSDLTNRREST